MILSTMLFYRFSCSWEKEAFLTRLILHVRAIKIFKQHSLRSFFLNAVDLKGKGSLYFWPHMTIKNVCNFSEIRTQTSGSQFDPLTN